MLVLEKLRNVPEPERGMTAEQPYLVYYGMNRPELDVAGLDREWSRPAAIAIMVMSVRRDEATGNWSRMR
jgi:hypothetical protein